MTPRTYKTPAAFKVALETRLKRQTQYPLHRARQLLVMERLVARLSATFDKALTLKGGLAVELRLQKARTTKDVDIRLVGDSKTAHERLESAGQLDLGDWLRFDIKPDPRHPDIAAEGMKYEGIRYRCQALLANKVYGGPFGLDVAFADAMVGVAELVSGSDTLAFAGILSPTIAVYPVETHIAEKIHAYTLPRMRENSRVKDLPDMALLASAGQLSGARIREAVRRTFEHRATHSVPKSLPAPPSSWKPVYERIAASDDLPWMTIEELVIAVGSFVDPILGDGAARVWNRHAWVWE